jgi:hypothetical protein
MKKTLLLACLCLVLTSCSAPAAQSTEQNPTLTPTAAPATFTPQPTLPPTPTATATPNGVYDLDGVQLVMPACLNATAAVTSVAAQAKGSDPAYFPEHRRITLRGYPLAEKASKPIIYIFPLQDYLIMDASITSAYEALSKLAGERPTELDGLIPFLPQASGKGIFQAQVTYLSFQNGSGVRSLTQFNAAPTAINNQEMVYAFSGITADAKYWVSAIFPVNAAYLQRDPYDTITPDGGMLAPSPTSTNYTAEMQDYYSLMTTLLNNTPANYFKPDLACLDSLVTSINVTR